jgi:hypothetical protein
MWRIAITSLLFLLINRSSYCQEIYPKILILSSDTVVVLQPVQIKHINLVFEHRKFLLAENEILNKTLNEYVMLSHQKDSILDVKIANEAIFTSKLELLSKEKYAVQEQNIRLKKNRKINILLGFIGGVVTTYLIMR